MYRALCPSCTYEAFEAEDIWVDLAITAHVLRAHPRTAATVRRKLKIEEVLGDGG